MAKTLSGLSYGPGSCNLICVFTRPIVTDQRGPPQTSPGGLLVFLVGVQEPHAVGGVDCWALGSAGADGGADWIVAEHAGPMRVRGSLISFTVSTSLSTNGGSVADALTASVSSAICRQIPSAARWSTPATFPSVT